MGAITRPDGLTAIFYQDSTNGSILGLAVSNDFQMGTYEPQSSGVVVPGDEVRANSPIAVSVVYDVTGDAWVEVRESLENDSINGTVHRPVWHSSPPTTS